MENTLGPGDIRVGQIVDKEDDSAWQAATLTFDEKSGAILVVPYVRGEEQFSRTEEWFRKQSPPDTLVFVDNDGFVTLSGVHWRGDSGGHWLRGRLGADYAIFNRPRKIKSEYKVRDFLSTIDGLEAFAGFRPVNYEIEQVGDERSRVTVVVDADESFSWRHGGFTYTVHAGAAWTAQDGSRFEVTDSSPYLQTSASKGATIRNHLDAHRPVRALLVMLHGDKVAWRSHRVRDDQFPTWMLSGEAKPAHFVEAQLNATIEQHRFPKPESGELRFPAARVVDLGSRGLRRWCVQYASEDVRRAVDPAVEVINGATRFVEPQMMMLAMSLDRFGYFHHGDQRRRPMWENIRRCLDEAGLDWPEVGGRDAIAKAIANLNNDLKHPDRPTYPSFAEIWCVNQLAKEVARAQVLALVGASKSVLEAFRKSPDVREAGDAFKRNRVRVSAAGAVSRLP